MACDVKLMFSPPFEVFCDLLMHRPMETQNIIKERCFFRLVTSMGQRKNSESPQEIKPQTFRFCALILYLSHRDSTVSKVYYLIYIYYFFKFYFIIYYSTACNQPTLTVFLAFNIQLNIIEWLFSEIRINIITRVS